MKLALLLMASMLISINSHAQLPANPWEKDSNPVTPEPEVLTETLTYDAGLPVDPWSQYKTKEPQTQARPQKHIPQINGLSANPIEQMIENQKPKVQP